MTESKHVSMSDLHMTEDYEYLHEGKPYTGVAIEHFEGHPLHEMTFLNGLAHGPERRWYPESAQLRSAHTNINGAAEGEKRVWYENGQRKSVAMIEEGILITQTVWNQQGEVVEEYRVEDDEDPFLFELLQMRRSGKNESSSL
ncbi:MAG: hypothetical protein EP343_03535 [Deltaproteobacteria bacterium]|nr:MAG: hypothetical protein EP343_03535 [Deltaproteobacteria bacterium]